MESVIIKGEFIFQGGQIMIAEINKVEQGCIVRFERQLTHSLEETWSWLTENEKMTQWFPELQIVELREGGFLQFDMQNGNVDKLVISELKLHSVFEFDWWGDTIRFELYQESEGCKLVMKETIKQITNHSPKDLAGWHVCLDVIEALMAGRTFEWRMEKWKEWFEQYKQAIEKIS
jgi:uncharacterized protein YndB with AHSA1/START domain